MSSLNIYNQNCNILSSTILLLDEKICISNLQIKYFLTNIVVFIVDFVLKK
jgi:hypothetical protein